MVPPAQRPPLEPSLTAAELVDGAWREKPAPDRNHANAQAGATTAVRGPFHRKSQPGGRGGWWILTEADVRLGAEIFRPDIAGWRRERVPVLPDERPLTATPDWICEVISSSNRAHDTVLKQRRYHQAGVPWYWLLDPEAGTLIVLKHEPQGYLELLVAERHEVVRPEPFAAVQVRVGLLLGDDPEE